VGVEDERRTARADLADDVRPLLRAGDDPDVAVAERVERLPRDLRRAPLVPRRVRARRCYELARKLD
jgi:hypothetical protein